MDSTTKKRPFTDHENRKPRSGRRGKPKVYEASQVVNLRNPCNTATWNAKTLCQAGKVHNVIKEMDRLSIGVLGTVTGVYQHGVGEALVTTNQCKSRTDGHNLDICSHS
ncbi:hypothetical protein Trydic_g16100 [Trypoxylus dichotomus]